MALGGFCKEFGEDAAVGVGGSFAVFFEVGSEALNGLVPCGLGVGVDAQHVEVLDVDAVLFVFAADHVEGVDHFAVPSLAEFDADAGFGESRALFEAFACEPLVEGFAQAECVKELCAGWVEFALAEVSAGCGEWFHEDEFFSVGFKVGHFGVARVALVDSADEFGVVG